jgi:hypothetical protein
MSHRPGIHKHGNGFRGSVTVTTPVYRTEQEAAAAREELKAKLSRIKLLRDRELPGLEDPCAEAQAIPAHLIPSIALRRDSTPSP